jgi:hypothetical protein
MDFVAAITSVTKAFEILKTMQDIDKNFDAASYKAKIAELSVALADARETPNNGGIGVGLVAEA